MASLLFLALALLLLLLGQTPAWNGLVGNMTINFLAIIIEALPFMLIGSLAGGLIEVFVPSAWVERAVRRYRILAVFTAGAMGLLLPVCECAIVPIVTGETRVSAAPLLTGRGETECDQTLAPGG